MPYFSSLFLLSISLLPSNQNPAREEEEEDRQAATTTTVGFVEIVEYESNKKLSMSATELAMKRDLQDSPMSDEPFQSEESLGGKKKITGTTSFVEKHKLITMIQEQEGSPMESPMTESGQWTDTGISVGEKDSSSNKLNKPNQLDLQDASIDTDMDVSEMSPINNEEISSQQATIIDQSSNKQPTESETAEVATSPITQSKKSTASSPVKFDNTVEQSTATTVTETCDANLSPILFTASKATSPMQDDRVKMVDASSSPPKRNAVSCSTSPPNLADLQQFYKPAVEMSPEASEEGDEARAASVDLSTSSADAVTKAATEAYTKGLMETVDNRLTAQSEEHVEARTKSDLNIETVQTEPEKAVEETERKTEYLTQTARVFVEETVEQAKGISSDLFESYYKPTATQHQFVPKTEAVESMVSYSQPKMEDESVVSTDEADQVAEEPVKVGEEVQIAVVTATEKVEEIQQFVDSTAVDKSSEKAQSQPEETQIEDQKSATKETFESSATENITPVLDHVVVEETASYKSPVLDIEKEQPTEAEHFVKLEESPVIESAVIKEEVIEKHPLISGVQDEPKLESQFEAVQVTEEEMVTKEASVTEPVRFEAKDFTDLLVEEKIVQPEIVEQVFTEKTGEISREFSEVSHEEKAVFKVDEGLESVTMEEKDEEEISEQNQLLSEIDDSKARPDSPDSEEIAAELIKSGDVDSKESETDVKQQPTEEDATSAAVESLKTETSKQVELVLESHDEVSSLDAESAPKSKDLSPLENESDEENSKELSEKHEPVQSSPLIEKTLDVHKVTEEKDEVLSEDILIQKHDEALASSIDNKELDHHIEECMEVSNVSLEAQLIELKEEVVRPALIETPTSSPVVEKYEEEPQEKTLLIEKDFAKEEFKVGSAIEPVIACSKIHEAVIEQLKHSPNEEEAVHVSSLDTNREIEEFEQTKSDEIDEVLLVVMAPGQEKLDVEKEEFDQVNAPRITVTPSFDEAEEDRENVSDHKIEETESTEPEVYEENITKVMSPVIACSKIHESVFEQLNSPEEENVERPIAEQTVISAEKSDLIQDKEVDREQFETTADEPKPDEGDLLKKSEDAEEVPTLCAMAAELRTEPVEKDIPEEKETDFEPSNVEVDVVAPVAAEKLIGSSQDEVKDAPTVEASSIVHTEQETIFSQTVQEQIIPSVTSEQLAEETIVEETSIKTFSDGQMGQDEPIAVTDDVPALCELAAELKAELRHEDVIAKDIEEHSVPSQGDDQLEKNTDVTDAVKDTKESIETIEIAKMIFI